MSHSHCDFTSWFLQPMYSHRSKLFASLRWCVLLSLSIIVLVLYATNQKVSGHNFGLRDFSSSGTNETSSKLYTTVGNFFYRRGINQIISEERATLAKSLENYPFKDSLELNDLLFESNGEPIRALVATTWRSGSTFMGDILMSHPATFYHYEPLLHFNIEQIRFGAKAKEALRVLKSLFRCDYSQLRDYIEFGLTHNNLFSHNIHLWKICQKYNLSLCWSEKFLSRFCKLFPFQSMKTVRLRFNLTRSLLEDSSLNIRAVLLVRDPRGTMQSRRHRDWCPGNPDCDDPHKLCSDLVDDYHSAQKLLKEFPGRVRVYRYEDFSLEAYNNTKQLLDFFGFSFHENVQAFLDTHTKINFGGVSSTFRDSKTAPFEWRKKLSFSDVQVIQSSCNKAMKLWGYKTVSNEDELATLEPLLPLKLEL